MFCAIEQYLVLYATQHATCHIPLGNATINCMIEIEKKFLLNEDQQRALLDGATELGQKLVRDSYFDTSTYSLTLRDFGFVNAMVCMN